MARTSAKAKKSRQEVLKSKAEEAQNEPSAEENEELNESTDKENDDSNYEVEKIVHTRTYRGKKQYLVRWKGYNDESDTWENESALNSCPDVLEAFNKENAEKEKAKNDNSENSGDENEKEESAMAKKRGMPKKSKKTKRDIGKANKDSEKMIKDDGKIVNDNEVTKESEEPDQNIENTKKRPKKEKNILPPKKAKRELEPSAGEDDDSNKKDYEVEKILEVHTRKDGRREFLIRWKGYRPSEDTWEPEAHLDCPDLIEKFMEKVQKAKNTPVRELRESRTPVDRFIPHGQVRGRANLRRNMGFRGLYQE